MSAADTDDPQVEHDTKSGWSSYCRRDEHRSCASFGAFCKCPCHGKRGQQPTPAPTGATPIRKEAPMTEPSTAESFTCDEPGCGRTFTSIQGVRLHQTRKHRPATDKVTPLRPKKEEAIAEPAAEADPWLVFVDGGHTLTLSTSSDADQVASLITSLGHRAWRFRLADGES